MDALKEILKAFTLIFTTCCYDNIDLENAGVKL